MSFGDSIQRRADFLRKRGADVERILRETCRGAAMQAVKAAQNKTPPTGDDLGGVSTRSGQLKEHWATDSKVEPQVRAGQGGGTEYAAMLRNNMDYASYVDQGHRMDKHFVPGLMVNPATGKLERVDPSMGGIMVGTKTGYVPGVFMAEAGREAFEDNAMKGLDGLAREVLGP